MITRIRDVRRAAGLTLADVAERCTPPTTPQTIGRLETGTRTVSVGWLNRIAAALGVDSAELVNLPESPDLPVVAVLGPRGLAAPRKPQVAVPPRPAPGMVALPIEVDRAGYRAGDTLWLDRLAPDRFADARDREVLVPQPAGRFAFGRLVAVDDGGVEVKPAGGGRSLAIASPAWLAVAVRLIRPLA